MVTQSHTEDYVMTVMQKKSNVRNITMGQEASEMKCNCDCECKKSVDEKGQCEDCDNGIHYDHIRKVYVNYDTGEVVR